MFEQLLGWIQASGGLVYVLAPAFTVLVAVLPIPAEIPAVLNGMVFGPVWGILVTWLSSLLGAQISFELARRFGRPFSERLLPATALDRADALVNAAGWPSLLALRLIPTVAFTALNWAAGFTCLPRGRFVWTTAVGILPGAIAFTTTGVGIHALIRDSVTGQLIFYSVLGLLVIASTVWFSSPALRRKHRTDPVD